MKTDKKVYQVLAQAIQAKKNCIGSCNKEWEENWSKIIEWLVDTMPSGSGFDCGTKLIEDECTLTKLVFYTEFHHMNEDGIYDGWTTHKVIVTPTFDSFDVRVTGKNRNDIKMYIDEVFTHSLIEICRKGKGKHEKR